MIRPLNVLTAACLCMVSLQTFAQIAEPLLIPDAAKERSVCAGNGMNAGTILNITPLGVQSNDINSDPIILCFGDQISINHAGDADLTDDPNLATSAGVGYAFYQCTPTVSGPDVAALGAEACLIEDPMPENGVLWVARGNAKGDIIFSNSGYVQNRFFGGSAGRMYFAPITITNFEATPPSFDDGSCFNINTSEAFSVIYLNQLELVNFSTPDNNSLSGMFSITGGYPEFDNNTNYSVTLTKIDDPTVLGTVDAAISHGGTTTFSVPEAGTYILSVIDPKGCSREFVVHVPSVDPIKLCLKDSTVMSGDNFCIPVTVADFNNVLSIAMTIGWNPSVIEFIQVDNVNPIFGSDIGFDDSRGAEGVLPVLFFEQNLNTIALPDSTVLFEVCFTAIGQPGTRTDISFINDPTEISITDDAADLAIILKPGTIVITNPSSLSLFHSACANPSGNVDLSLQVFGGSDPYNYDILISSTMAVYDAGSLFGGITTFSNVPPDVYDVVITDANGIPVTRTIDLNLNSIQVDTLITDPSCMGADDGAIEILDITGGLGPYNQVWTGPGFTKYGISRLDDLTEGTYNLVISDANGCRDTLDIELVEGGLNMSTSVIAPVCSGQTGEITLTVAGAGSENYEWTWSNSDGSLGRTMTAPSPLVITNLMPDTYSVTLTSGACEIEQTIPLLPLKTISIELDTANSRLATSCGGDRDGRLDINVSADRNQSAFQFFWDQVTQDSGTVTIEGAMNHTFVTDLPGSTYTLNVVDAQGCEATESFTIIESRPLNVDQQALSQFVTQPDCPDGLNGRIDLGFADLVIGGTPFPSGASYRYRWYDIGNGNILINDRSSQIRDLPAGTYGVYLEDFNGCNDSTVFELMPGPTVSIVLDQENICAGDSVAQLSAFGDLTGNTINWSNGETSPTISNLKEGKYYVSVTETMDGNTCTTVDSIDLVDPRVAVRVVRPMQFNVTSLCNEPDTGLIYNLELAYTGRMGNDFIWHTLDDTMTSVNFINVTESGDYPFTVIDRVTGCIVYDSVVTAQFPEKIDVIVDTTQVSCNGAQDGVITVSATGRGGLFDFDWSVNNFSVNNATMSSQTLLSPGQYMITVTESSDSSCRVPLMINITEPEVLTLSVDSSFTRDIRCFGEDNGQIGLIWEGGNQDAAPTIVWSAGGASNTLSATDLMAGDYNIELTDSRGCMDDIDVTITEPPQLFATVPVPEDPICNGYQTSVVVTDANGGTGSSYTFSVDNGAPQPLGTPYLTYAGEYIVSVFDEQGCRIDTTMTINEPQPITVDLGEDLDLALGDTTQLNPLIIGPSTIDTYSWTPEDLLSCNNCDDPFVFPLEDQEFRLTVIDINGCQGQDQIRINVDKARLVYIPNAFTPNGDGLNEKWQIYTGPGVKGILGVHVFDRWGNLIFENNTEEGPSPEGSSGWDGRISGSIVHPGVYVYLVEVEFIDGRILTYRGDVTLVP
ncbi:MAG: gliding motility-associated C-terminal domain-containing protein [Saprospiraceae bacterium]|nr:gliding motility-associated C-terminal domain-containing protein [Saprospiraceae bacterium]